MIEQGTPAPAAADVETVVLERPIARGDTAVDRVAVRRPLPLDLAGLSLRDIVDMEASAMMTLLPRVTDPPLLAIEVQRMHSLDFLALAAEASGFFLPKAVRPVSPPQ